MKARDDDWGDLLRKAGAMMALPALLVSGPLAGYLVGFWLDKKFGWDPWAKAALMVLGFAGSAREVWRMVRREAGN